MIYDAAIIGAGIVGSAIARELSRYRLKVCVIEKESDVSCGASKANSGIIHAGYDPEPGTLMARFNAEGNPLFTRLAEELHFDFSRIGSLVIGFDDADLRTLHTLKERGEKNGVQGLRILTGDEARAMEGRLNRDVTAALFAPSAGIISPYQATWSLAENAAQNGVRFFLNSAVRGITREPPEDLRGFVITTGKGAIRARFVINAAGLFADEISRMAGARDFSIIPRRGEYTLLDSNTRGLTGRVVFQTPGVLGKGVLVTPTVDGNILIGPSADDCEDKRYTDTTRAGQDFVIQQGERSFPGIPRRNIINSFAGVRAIAYHPAERAGEPVGDFIIEEDSAVRGFINVAGISSPGLTSAPAIALHVKHLLEEAGLTFTPNPDFIPLHRGIESFRNADPERKAQLIAENPLYGRVICRCEMITEAEILQAVRGVIGAEDLDGVKRRTRAGMGRCQGGFCSPRITEIISRERSIPMIHVTKNGGSSFILNSRLREAKSTREVCE
ncbi:MAG: NAD(P)/FAD-dependent oxidoreductase [Spirochaetaceae bacterium]|jgi:glycerol-3-phosphate dehydrogenase|nr:NAD(P)/FAD-dependent oxidoreductase [Spirochaetaceae bacterium]